MFGSTVSMVKVFPAYVGMSPVLPELLAACDSVPRIRGDEPVDAICRAKWEVCSPHTWG